MQRALHAHSTAQLNHSYSKRHPSSFALARRSFCNGAQSAASPPLHSSNCLPPLHSWRLWEQLAFQLSQQLSSHIPEQHEQHARPILSSTSTNLNGSASTSTYMDVACSNWAMHACHRVTVLHKEQVTNTVAVFDNRLP
eukprot:1159351-Pelagomonas_calceolata.AAC.3